MINSESTGLAKHESFALLERYLNLMARDPGWTPSAESLIELWPAFTEESAGVLAELVNRFEMDQEMVRAYIDLYDAYVVTLYDARTTGDTAIDYSLPEIEAFFERVVDSFQYLEGLHEASASPGEFIASMRLINHGLLENGHRDCSFELYTPSPAGEVLRDRFDAELPSAVLGAAIADSLAAAITYSCEPRSAIRHADFYSRMLQ